MARECRLARSVLRWALVASFGCTLAVCWLRMQCWVHLNATVIARAYINAAPTGTLCNIFAFGSRCDRLFIYEILSSVCMFPACFATVFRSLWFALKCCSSASSKKSFCIATAAVVQFFILLFRRNSEFISSIQWIRSLSHFARFGLILSFVFCSRKLLVPLFSSKHLFFVHFHFHFHFLWVLFLSSSFASQKLFHFCFLFSCLCCIVP